jgi:hypothetical protein
MGHAIRLFVTKDSEANSPFEGSERRLRMLAANPDTSLAEEIGELRRIELLHPQLAEIRPLLDKLEKRARELRAEWVAHSG